MTRPRILVLGSDGQVGFQLMRTLAPLGDVTGSRLDGAAGLKIDVTDHASLERVLLALRPNLIVNAVAYTAVDRAEEEPALATTINATAVGVLGGLAARLGAAVVHYSTDYVYAGITDRPWREDDPAAPANVYGRSKLAGDEALLASGADALILRTSWVYATRGHNFLRTIVRLAREREELRIVDDQWGAPTWARSIAEAIAAIAARAGRDRASVAASFAARGGVFHMTAAGRTNWHRFAQHVLQQIDDPERRLRSIAAIPTTEYPTPARRPINSVLDCTRLARLWGVALPPWELALELAVAGGGLPR